MNASNQAVGLALVAFVTAGCTSGGDTPTGTVGEAGYGVFHYQCAETADPVCNVGGALDPNEVGGDLGVAGQIPASVAVGGRFELDYYGQVPESGGSGQLIEIVPARDDVVSTGGGFRFTEPATVAFLARNPQGATADFIHVTATEPTNIELWVAGQRPTAVTIATPGAATVAAVVLVDADDVHLAGAQTCSWSSTDEAVVRIAAVGSEGIPTAGTAVYDDEVRVVGIAEGEATLRVEFGDFARELAITVGPEVTP